MASVRKRHADVVAAASDSAAPPAVDNATLSTSTPSPAEPVPSPISEQVAPAGDAASEALRQQLLALGKAEAQTRRREWLGKNPAALKNIAALDKLHHEALQAGLADTSPDYFDFMSDRLAALAAQNSPAGAHLIHEMQKRITANAPQPPQPRPASVSHVSAPVSRREVSYSSTPRPMSGSVTLTPEQKEFARISGVTETEYARQLTKYESMKADGTYGERQ
jgi:hypothetical protein